MSSSALPPLGNLPSWSRVSTLDRSRYPKPFLRDRLQALPPPGAPSQPQLNYESNQAAVDFKFLDGIPPADQQRLIYYNKSIKFLQHQHSETLRKLHEEIDCLKRQNKDLQFQYLMLKGGGVGLPTFSGSASQATFSSSHSDGDKAELSVSETPMNILQDELKSLQEALKQAKAQNLALHKAVNSKKEKRRSAKSRESDTSQLSTEPETNTYTSVKDVQDKKMLEEENHPDNLSLPLGATIDPLQVRDTPQDEPRSPTLSECQDIIKHLYKVNNRQTMELSKLKSNLRNVLSAKQPPPEINGAKYFIRDNKSATEASKLPKVLLKKPIARKPLHSSAGPSEHVSLPALKNTMNTNIADRRKRQQAVQKGRAKKEFQIQ